MSDLAYGTPVKAANADVWMITKSTFTDFPNLWVGPSLTSSDEDLRRESAAEGLQLGHARSWCAGASADGKRAQGHSVQAGELRSEQEVSDDRVLLRDPLEQPATATCRRTAATSSTRRTTCRTAISCSSRTSCTRTGIPGMSAYKSIVPGVQSLLAARATSTRSTWASRASRGADIRRRT